MVAESDHDLLLVADLNQSRPLQRPFEDRHHLIGGVEADDHADQQRRAAFDQHPAKVFEMFEKCLYRPAAVLLDLLWTRLFSGIGHERTCRLNSIRIWARRKVERWFQRWNWPRAFSEAGEVARPLPVRFRRSPRVKPF